MTSSQIPQPYEDAIVACGLRQANFVSPAFLGSFAEAMNACGKACEVIKRRYEKNVEWFGAKGGKQPAKIMFEKNPVWSFVAFVIDGQVYSLNGRLGWDAILAEISEDYKNTPERKTTPLWKGEGWVVEHDFNEEQVSHFKSHIQIVMARHSKDDMLDHIDQHEKPDHPLTNKKKI